MTMEPVWTLFLGIGVWLLDPVPWLVIVLAMLFLPQRLGSRRAFVVSVVLGAAAGFAVMCSIGGCEGASPGLLGVAAFRAVSAACIVALVVAGLLKLGQRWADRDRKSN
jgi:hypothetical protein